MGNVSKSPVDWCPLDDISRDMEDGTVKMKSSELNSVELSKARNDWTFERMDVTSWTVNDWTIRHLNA